MSGSPSTQGRAKSSQRHIAKAIARAVRPGDRVAESLVVKNWRFPLKHPEHGNILGKDVLDATIVHLGIGCGESGSSLGKQIVDFRISIALDVCLRHAFADV